MDYLFLLLPVFGWGFMQIIANLKKSDPKEQLLGTAISAFLLSLMVYLIVKPPITYFAFGIGFISGIFWSGGQLLQFVAIKKSSVSTSMPISTGSQLIFTTLFSAIVFKEWHGINEYAIGSFSILIVILGIYLCSKRKNQNQSNIHLNVVLILCCSSFLLMTYVVINKIFNINGLSILLSQTSGILCSSIVIVLFSKERSLYKVSNVVFNFLTGISWFLGNIGLFISTSKFDVSKVFAISQTNIIVATIFGIIIFKEKKTRIEWMYIMGGIILIMAGIFILSTIQQKSSI